MCEKSTKQTETGKAFVGKRKCLTNDAFSVSNISGLFYFQSKTP